MGRKIANTFHPSFSIVEGLSERGWSQVQFSRCMGISLQYAHDLLKGRRGISPRVAIALEFNGFGSAAYWMRMQAAYEVDLYRQLLAEKKKAEKKRRT